MISRPYAVDYRPDVDGLRAVAVALVVAYHAAPKAVPGGFIGVDVFFVISGFLITSIILSDIAAGRFTYARFYERRIRRLFPALAIVLLTTLAAGYVVLLPGEFEALGRHVAGGSVYISNNVLRREAGYFDVTAEMKPLLHLWSLAVEEQFYLVWPLLLVTTIRASQPAVPWVIAGVTVLSLAASIGLTPRHPITSFFMPHTRIWELGIGAMLAAATAAPIRSTTLPPNGGGVSARWFREVLSVSGALLIAAAVVAFDTTWRYPSGWALLPCLGTAALIAAGPSAVVNRVLSFPVLVFVGLISYPLYLWHWPLLSFMSILDVGQSPAGRATAVGIAFALAVVTYFVIERPVQARPTRRVAIGLFTIVLVIGALGLLAATGYWKARLDGSPLALRDAARQDWRYPKGMKLLPGPSAVQHYVKGTGRNVVLFVGDSHIEQFWPRIERLVDRGDGSVRAEFATYGGCAPVPGVVKEDGRCTGFAERVFALAASPDVKAVVLGAAWAMYLHHGGYRLATASGIRTLGPNTADIEPFVAALDTAISRLVALGKQVWLVLPMPSGVGLDPMHGVVRVWWGARPITEGATDRGRLEADAAAVRRALQMLGRSRGLRVVDPADYLCDATHCPAADSNGRPRYKDSNHLRSTFVAESIDFFDELFPARAGAR